MRYIPTLAVLLLFFMSSLPFYLVEGPSMGFLENQVEACKSYWWSSLLLVQNYVNTDRMVRFIDRKRMFKLYNLFSIVHGSNLVFECRLPTFSYKSNFHLPALEVQVPNSLAFWRNYLSDTSHDIFCSISVSVLTLLQRIV